MGKGIPGRGNSLYKVIESREIRIFKGVQEFSMLPWLGARNEAEEVGGSHKSLVCHAKEFSFSKSSVEV